MEGMCARSLSNHRHACLQHEQTPERPLVMLQERAEGNPWGTKKPK